jgi:aspartate/glutamate racemase
MKFFPDTLNLTVSMKKIIDDLYEQGAQSIVTGCPGVRLSELTNKEKNGIL